MGAKGLPSGTSSSRTSADPETGDPVAPRAGADGSCAGDRDGGGGGDGDGGHRTEEGAHRGVP